MNPDSTRDVLLKLLGETRECVNFLNELGVETLTLDSIVDEVSMPEEPDRSSVPVSSVWREAAGLKTQNYNEPTAYAASTKRKVPPTTSAEDSLFVNEVVTIS